MNKPIFTALSPNTEKDDLALARKLLFQPGRWQQGRSVSRLEKSFKSFFKAHGAFAFSSGRTALWALLKALGIGSGDEILLQAYTCVVVPEAIIRLGGRPVWVDIDYQSFNLDVQDLERKITPRTKVIIVQHTFGQAADLTAIKKIAGKYRLCLIEDCAQALGAEYQGRPVGIFGEAAFFSFGRDKNISSIFGGLALTNDRQINQRLKKIQEELPLPPKAWIAQQLFHPVAFNLIMKHYLSFGKSLHYLLSRLGLLSRATRTPAALFSRMPNGLAALAWRQWRKLNRFNQHRCQLAVFYDQHLAGLPIEKPLIRTGDVFLRYTIKTDRARELIAFSQKRGVFLGDWYWPVIAPSATDYQRIGYQPGSCPQAEKASRRSVNLPTHPNLTLQDAKKVVKILKEFYDH